MRGEIFHQVVTSKGIHGRVQNCVYNSVCTVGLNKVVRISEIKRTANGYSVISTLYNVAIMVPRHTAHQALSNVYPR